MLAHWLISRRLVPVPHRSLYSRIQSTNNTTPRFRRTMASTLDALNAELAQQTELSNRLRIDKSDPTALEESRKRLGEIKRELAALKPGGKDTKKKERLLLKTAKVRLCNAPPTQPTLFFILRTEQTRARVIMAPARCFAASTSNA